MTITFKLNDETVNDQTIGLQTGDDLDDLFTDTDVAYGSLPSSFRTYLETTLSLSATFPTSIGVATMTNSVTVTASTGAQLTGVSFTDSTGGALDGDDSGLNTIDGKDILLYADGNDTVIGKYDSDGVGGVDAVAFVIRKQDVLNAGGTSDQVTFNVVTYVPISHPTNTDPDDAVNLGNNLKLAASEKLTFNFAGTPSGDHLFTMVGSGTSGLIATPDSEVIKLHVSQGGGPTTLGLFNQMIDPNETLVVTFVNNPNPDFTVKNLSQGEADLETNIQFGSLKTINGGSVTISQTQGNDPAGMLLTASIATGTTESIGNNFIQGYGDDGIATISAIRVKNAAGTLLLSTTSDVTTPVNGITVDFLANGQVEVRGLEDDYTVEYDAGSHQRIRITGLEGKFDIGAIGVSTPGSESTFVGQQIVIEDDGPTAPTFVTNTIDVVHDETPGIQNGGDDVLGSAFISGGSGPTVAELFSGLTGTGDDPDVADNPIGYARSGSALVTPSGGDGGTDGTASTKYELKVSSAGADSGVSTTEGTEVFLYQLSATLIVGRVGTEGTPDTADLNGKIAFAVAIDPDSGEVFTTQYLSLKHPTFPDSDDESIALTDGAVQVTVTITDKDGDKASASDNVGNQIKFEDDGPNDYDPQNQSILNFAGGSISGDLDTGGNTGSDGFGSVVFTGFSNGDPATDISGKTLTSGGKDIELNGAGTGTLTGYVDVNGNDKVDTGETVFTLQLDSKTDSYQFTLVKEIDDGSSAVNLDFDDVVGGNKEWFFFNSNEGPKGNQDVLFTSILQQTPSGEAQTANRSASDIGVANQWIGDSKVPTDEGLRIDFATDVSGTPTTKLGLAAENGFIFDDHFQINNAGFTIAQIKGGGTTDIKVRLSDVTNNAKTKTDQASYDAFANLQTTIAIIGIVVTNGTTTKVEGVDYNIIADANGFVKITGLDALDHVKLTGATDYERIEVAYAGGHAFGINNISYEQGTAGNPLDLQFKTLLTDGDGDTSSGLIDINLQPADNSGDTFTGFTGDDKLFGGGGNDTVDGGAGKDTIDGGAGNDTITGGAGDDTIDVSQGDDRVVYTSSVDGKDVVNGFDSDNTGGQDYIDLDALFDDAKVASADRSGRVAIVDDGANVQIQVDVAGDGFGAGDVQITLTNVDHLTVSKGTAAIDDIQLGTL